MIKIQLMLLLMSLLFSPLSSSFAANSTTSDLKQFQQNIEEALVWRSKAIGFAEQAKASIQNGHLSPNELQIFIEGAEHYLAIREQILAQANRASWLVDSNTQLEFNPETATLVKHQGNESRVSINPSDPEGRAMLMQLNISLAAALVLYDNYLLGIHPFWNEQKLRYLINNDNPKVEGQLGQITSNYLALAHTLTHNFATH